MKKLIVIVLSVFVLSTLEVIGQCNSETFSNQCIPKLATGFNFLKSYKIEKGGKDYVEYSYVFTKGTQYMINICAATQPTDGIVVSLFDSGRNKVASSKVNGQFISAIAYPAIQQVSTIFSILLMDQPDIVVGARLDSNARSLS
jgi:hypothetical protein